MNADPTYIFIAAGRALVAQDEWELAAEAFRQALRLRPDYAEAWAFLGESLQHFNLNDTSPDPEADLPELMRAYHINTSSMTANLLLSLYWQRQGAYDQALQYIQ